MQRQILFVFGSQACVPSDPLLAAKRLGCRTAIIGPNLPCGVGADLVDSYERVSLNRLDLVVEAAQALHRGRPVHGVIGYDDQAVPAVARIAAALGLPGHPVEAADAARDKVVMKQRLEAAGVPIARYTLAADEDDAVRWAEETGYPVVVKPVRGSASQGVIRADGEDDLRAAYRRLRRIVRDHRLDTGGRPDREQLVESYLEGTEISVELMVRDGVPHVVCLFAKPLPLQGPFFEETIYVTPARLPDEQRRQAETWALRAARALGLRTGFAHCELRLTADGPFVLEIAARLIGGACSRVFRSVIGDDIHTYVLRLALGDDCPIPQPLPTAAGAMMLPIPREGRLVAVRGLDLAAKVAGVQDVICDATPGDVILPFPEQGCYIGFLTAKAETPEAVVAALSEAAAKIELEMELLCCDRWTRAIADHRDYQPPAELGITSLAGYSLAEARQIVVPLVAAAHFGELPLAQAWAEAEACVRWLEEGNRGKTSPALWLVAEDRGVALGSYDGETCYISCLGVVPGKQGGGLGEALVRSLMALFAQLGCTEMEEWGDPRHLAGVGLFERLGFVRRGADGAACSTCC